MVRRIQQSRNSYYGRLSTNERDVISNAIEIGRPLPYDCGDQGRTYQLFTEARYCDDSQVDHGNLCPPGLDWGGESAANPTKISSPTSVWTPEYDTSYFSYGTEQFTDGEFLAEIDRMLEESQPKVD